MIVAIHQPNYVPWLGYFNKIARADIFVFLDDVQFSKGSYINRVQIRGGKGARWLTQPVTVSLGMSIKEVEVAKPDWQSAHLDSLQGAYRTAGAFKSVWPDIKAIYSECPDGSLATINRKMIEALTTRLGIAARLLNSSEIDTQNKTGDDRIIAIVEQLAPGGTYLSGKGGNKYQEPAKFTAAGLTLANADFSHPLYEQGGGEFIPGLSVFDAVFHLGWDGAAALIAD